MSYNNFDNFYNDEKLILAAALVNFIERLEEDERELGRDLVDENVLIHKSDVVRMAKTLSLSMRESVADLDEVIAALGS